MRGNRVFGTLAIPSTCSLHAPAHTACLVVVVHRELTALHLSGKLVCT